MKPVILKHWELNIQIPFKVQLPMQILSKNDLMTCAPSKDLKSRISCSDAITTSTTPKA